MKLNAKLGLLIIASSILGLVVFIVLSLVIGDIVSKGYAPRELNALGRQMAEEAEADPIESGNHHQPAGANRVRTSAAGFGMGHPGWHV